MDTDRSLISRFRNHETNSPDPCSISAPFASSDQGLSLDPAAHDECQMNGYIGYEGSRTVNVALQNGHVANIFVITAVILQTHHA